MRGRDLHLLALVSYARGGVQAVAAALEAKLASELTFKPKVNPSKGHRAQPQSLEVRLDGAPWDVAAA